MTQQPDRVRQFLRRQGCPASVVRAGLDGLLDQWESVVSAIGEGYDLSLPDYRHDMDGRDLLRGALEVAGGDERRRAERRLEALDRRFRELTVECGPVWGEDVALENGHDPTDQWWYYRRPRQPGPDFEEELREAGFV
jgi:hypothetical protein